MGRKGKNNESKKPPSKGPNKNNGSQKQAKGRKIDSVATGLNRIVKVTLTSDEQTMILDVLSSLSTYKKSNVSNLQEDNKALDKDGSDNDDDNNDGDDDEPNLDINPVSGFSVPILKRAPIDTPSKASKGRIYSQMNRFDQRGYIKKMVRDDRFRRRADERMEKQIRHDRYIENERLRLESIVLTDAPAAVADDAYASDANSAPCKAEADVIDDDENDENVEDDDGEDDDDVNDDEEEDEDDDDGGDDADDGDEDDQNTAEPSYWKPPNRHTQRTETEHSVGPLCIDPTLSITLKEKLEQYKFSPETAEMRTTKESLPIFQSKETILRMIGQNQVTVISGETGSGKTTQLPAYLYESMVEQDRGSECYIICTQPRRIAAISVAERVSQEFGEKVGNTVGYQIRLESRYHVMKTRILYCTTGVLLRKLHQPGFLSQVSHIIVDEVHERQIETDFLLTLLKTQVTNYASLKLVLMSATVQDSLFSGYFNCPVLHVTGRMFPVDIKYIDACNALMRVAQLKQGSNDASSPSTGSVPNKSANHGRRKKSDNEDGDDEVDPNLKPPVFNPELVAELVIRIMQTYHTQPTDNTATTLTDTIEGTSDPIVAQKGQCILVFLSGLQAIEKVSRALRSRNLQAMRAFVLTLHSTLPPYQQRRVFQPAGPGEWKIVLATNIAETSVTVDDVTHVVDCGYHKEMQYDPQANMSILQEAFVSRASARQRAGRAGRVQKGTCWRMYSDQFFESDAVQAFPLPEIRRVPLEEAILQVILLELGTPYQFLRMCPEPPSSSQIQTAINTLIEIKAVLPLAQLPLTALGYHLAKFPVDVQIGKMLIFASLLNCIEPVLTIAAALSGKSPFSNPPNKAEEAYKAHISFYRRFQYPDSTINSTSEQKGATSSTSNARLDPSQRDGHFNKNLLFSDHLAVVNAFESWREVLQNQGRESAYEYCRDHYLLFTAMEDIAALRDHYRRYLIDAGFLSVPRSTTATAASTVTTQNSTHEHSQEKSIEESEYKGDRDEENWDENLLGQYNGDIQVDTDETDEIMENMKSDMMLDMVRCAMCAGLAPNIACATKYAPSSAPGKKKGADRDQPTKIFQKDKIEVFLHPSSLTCRHVSSLIDISALGNGRSRKNTGRIPDTYLVYHKQVATSKVYVYDCSTVPLPAILLFAGDIKISKNKKFITVNKWMQFKISEMDSVLLKSIQDQFDSLLCRKAENLKCNVTVQQNILISLLENLLDSPMTDD